MASKPKHHKYEYPAEIIRIDKNNATGLYEIETSIIYKMSFEDFVAMKASIGKYDNLQSWYNDLDEETKNGIYQILGKERYMEISKKDEDRYGSKWE